VSKGRVTFRPAAIAATAAVACLPLVACGEDEERNYNKGFRPPVTLTVGLTLEPGKARISPSKIGGGPAAIKISNQTGAEVIDVRLRPAAGDGCVRAEAGSGPIPPAGSGTLNATLIEGICEVVSNGSAVTRFRVVGQRPSAQNTLLLP